MTNASDWSGAVGDVWAREWQRTDRSFAGLAPHLNAAILEQAPPGAARIVDIGCGAGATSIAVATALPTAQVIGVDLSAELTAVATHRGRALGNLRFETGPIEERLGAVAPVDLFISRHGVMFFPEPVAAFAALRQAVSAKGGLVFSCFRSMTLNPWATELIATVQTEPQRLRETYEPGPFAFADPVFVTTMLAAAGWTQVRHTPVDFTYRAGEGVNAIDDAISFFRRIGPTAPILRTALAHTRAQMTDRIAAVAARYHHGDAVDFPAAAWLWSAKAE